MMIFNWIAGKSIVKGLRGQIRSPFESPLRGEMDSMMILLLMGNFHKTVLVGGSKNSSAPPEGSFEGTAVQFGSSILQSLTTEA